MIACGLVLLAVLAVSQNQPPPPTFEANAVVPSSGRHPVPLAPGLLISIYGSHLGPAVGCVGQVDTKHRETPSPQRPKQSDVETLIYPRQLCDVQVFVGGIASGLLYVQAKQINFKVPQETPIEGTTELRVVYKGQSSRPVTLLLGLK
jgi:uncharacterized protein (TIGR03437 family)